METCSNLIDNLAEELKQRTFQPASKSPVVSVVVPAYNMRNYLVECMNSIIDQTFTDMEIIIVNDGSKDETLSLAYTYAQFDPRVRVINQENQGLAIARKNGLKEAIGKYVLFIDSDDYIDTTLVEKCVRKMDEHQTDFVVFGAHSVKEGRVYSGIYDNKKFPRNFANQVVSFEQYKSSIFKIFPTAWCKLYRRDFIQANNIKFQEIRYGEDQLFFVHAMLVAKKIFVLDENLYFYRRSRANSITANNLKSTISPIEHFYAIEDLTKRLNTPEKLSEKILGRYVNKSLSWYGKCRTDFKGEYFENLEKLLTHAKENYPTAWWKNLQIDKNDNYAKTKFKIFFAKLTRKFK